MKAKILTLLIATIVIPVQSKAQVQQNHELLNAVLWNQTAAEYTATCVQAYELAKIRLEEAIVDTNWTAAVEQTENYQSLPPAVILDVDETTLNNAAYDAWLVNENRVYDSDSWNIWVQNDHANAVPGAAEFCQYATSLGIEVFFISNRIPSQQNATVRNLQMEGFPIDDSGENLLLKNEHDDWNSDKTTRRSYIAQQYRILLSIGDDANNFISSYTETTEEQYTILENHKEYFGRQWIIIPNSMYGGWESGAFQHDYSLSHDQRIQSKYEALISIEELTPEGSWSRETGQNHEMLNSVLWVQNSGEYLGTCLQAYEFAKIRMLESLTDSNWTATFDQPNNYQDLPPCVVINIDEVILNNVHFESALILSDSAFDLGRWYTWIEAAKASAVPGALEFTQFAKSQGVKVIYITNREKQFQAETIENLTDLGFTIDEDGSNLLMLDPEQGWGENKHIRQAYAAQSYRVVLLIGYEGNDFMAGTQTNTFARNSILNENLSMFGNKWIIIPNSMYGEWDSGIYNQNFSLSREEILRLKYNALQVAPSLQFRSNFENFSLYK
jgi:5'-nucleotidase (lipoprotein e(P4) family)